MYEDLNKCPINLPHFVANKIKIAEGILFIS